MCKAEEEKNNYNYRREGGQNKEPYSQLPHPQRAQERRLALRSQVWEGEGIRANCLPPGTAAHTSTHEIHCAPPNSTQPPSRRQSRRQKVQSLSARTRCQPSNKGWQDRKESSWDPVHDPQPQSPGQPQHRVRKYSEALGPHLMSKPSVGVSSFS